MKTSLFFLTMLLTAGFSCSKKPLTTNRPFIDQLPYNIISTFEQPAFKQHYELNNAINPFYISGNFDGDGQADYAVYLYNKNSKKPAIAFIRGEHSVIKELSDFTCFENTSVVYWKETNRFPAGSGLPNRGGGIVVGLGKDDIRWLYWDGSDWKCVKPD
jgi:hypothetical protein